jgi:hypothetical protein
VREEHILIRYANFGRQVYIEEIRLQTLSTYGLHHVQIDVEVLLSKMNDSGYLSTNDDKGVLALVEEIVSSGYKRCIEAIPLDPEVCKMRLYR